MTAADVAYILYQAPVLVAVHAAEMLTPKRMTERRNSRREDARRAYEGADRRGRPRRGEARGERRREARGPRDGEDVRTNRPPRVGPTDEAEARSAPPRGRHAAAADARAPRGLRVARRSARGRGDGTTAIPCCCFRCVSRRVSSDALLVRVIPTLLSDSFESRKAVSRRARHGEALLERRLARRRREDRGRAAWRRRGRPRGGRAAWIDGRLSRVDPAPRRHERTREDVLAVAPQQPTATGPPRATYWVAVWRARRRAASCGGTPPSRRGRPGRPRGRRHRPGEPGPRAPAAPLTRADVAVSVAYLELPPRPGRRSSWTRAPRAPAAGPVRAARVGAARRCWRRSARGCRRGPVGPVPRRRAGASWTAGAGGPDELLGWSTSTGRSRTASVSASRWTRTRRRAGAVFVLGLRLRAAPGAGGRAGDVALPPRHGGTGLAVVPQGTPTNNTEGGSASGRDDPDATCRLVRVPASPDARRSPPRRRVARGPARDRPRSCRTPGAGTDQLEARAMNTALWPATLGYFTRRCWSPLDDADSSGAAFFTGTSADAARSRRSASAAAVRHPADDRVLAMPPPRERPVESRLHAPARARGDWAALPGGVADGLGGDARRCCSTCSACTDLGRVPPALRREPRGPVQPRQPVGLGESARRVRGAGV